MERWLENTPGCNDRDRAVILFGHPTGNPNSHHAALAHYESGALEAFCVPWMPTPGQIAALRRVPGLSRSAGRLARRWFEPLRNAPRVEGRLGEWVRLARRLAAQAGVTFIALCGQRGTAGLSGPEREASLLVGLQSGRVPGWLHPVLKEGPGFRVWRVER